jgi:hypothetical protein
VLLAEVSFSDVLAWIFVAVLFVGWLLLVILMLIDMFRDPTLSTAAKIGWTVLIVLLPLIGIFAYLLVRGNVVGRRLGAARAAKAAAESTNSDEHV